MQEQARCWVCHRTVEEVTSTVDTETPEEKEIKTQMSQVAWYRSKFTESADLWRRSMPRDFKDMDFQFVASNAEQFSSIKTLAEVLDAKKLMLDWLAKASSILRDEGQSSEGLDGYAQLDPADRESVLRLIDQFEAKWRRSLVKEGSHDGYASGFEGLKLFDGLEFLIAQGLLFYDVRSQLSALAMAKAVAKKPRKSVRMFEANGYPPVPLCSVCESLIMGLRTPERRPESTTEVTQAEETEPVEQTAEPMKVAQAVEVPEGVSQQVSDIIKKLGPATKEAPKTRNLHEHRIKEEWDEVLQRKGS